MIGFLRIMQIVCIALVILALVMHSYFGLVFAILALWYEFEIRDL